MNQACSIFFYEGYIGVAPTIINTSIILDRRGYQVTIYGTKNNFPQPGKIEDNTKVIYFRKGSKIFELLRQLKLNNFVPLLEVIIYTLQCCVHHLKVRQNSVNIGVDIYGSICALIIFYLFKQKFLFLSLELHEPDRFEGISKILGKLAKLAYEKSEGLIIQDEDRFQTFCKYYGYKHPQVFYLPNSPLAASDRDSEAEAGNFFREKFNLSEEQFPYLILQAGVICDGVFSKSLADAFTSINNGSALIFHDRQERKAELDPYIKLLQQSNSKNLFLSLEPVPYDQIDMIYTAPTIGLAFYADLGNNFAQISKASGKLCQYLKHGKPVLVNNLPSLVTLIEQYQFGIVISEPLNPVEIQSAIEQIMSNYDTYSRNAQACFEAEFDFGKKMEPVLLFMENLL